MDGEGAHGVEKRKKGRKDIASKRAKKSKKVKKKKKSKKRRRVSPSPTPDTEDPFLQLLYAARKNDAAKVEALLAGGAVTPTSAHLDGLTALHVASAFGAVAVAVMLLDRGALPDAAGSGGDTPLHLAVKHHHAEIVVALLHKGASPGIANVYGETSRSLGMKDLLVEHHARLKRARDGVDEAAYQRRLAAERRAEALREAAWREKLEGVAAEPAFDAADEYSRVEGFEAEWKAEEAAGERGPSEDWFAAIAHELRSRRRQEADRKRREAVGGGSFVDPPPRSARRGEAGDAKASPHPPLEPAPLSNDDLRRLRELQDAQWQQFSDAALEVITMADVPWPSLPGASTRFAGAAAEGPAVSLCFGTDMTADEVKARLRALRMRWHPDKFEQKFGSRLEAERRDGILDRVKAVVQAVNAHADLAKAAGAPPPTEP